jgi:phosphomannomutase
MSIFKSYDIRGVYGKEWDARIANAIGRALPRLLSAGEIVVGRDARLSSEEIFRSLAAGIQDSGCRVADIGVCDTPAVYFATARFGFAGGVMITASHNPPEYNGLKISGRESIPVGYGTGLERLEKMIENPAPPLSAVRGGVRPLDIRGDYLAHLARFKKGISGTSAVIDCL